MARQVDHKYWRQQLLKPDWYVELYPEFVKIEKELTASEDRSQRQSLKEEVYQLVETALIEKTLPLAQDGPEHDAERRMVDTLVFHHTKNQPGMTLTRLNAIHCLRLYAAYYFSCKDRQDDDFKLYGQALWSNHFQNDQQVFYGYHWLIRQDGQPLRLLSDESIAWHAGCWHVNTRSIAMAFDDNLHGGRPTEAALRTAVRLIKTHYPAVRAETIIAHSDVRSLSDQLSMAAWRDRFLSAWLQNEKD